ncbi:DNA translocase FtsK 4TM domain-containing protein, partial [Alphaproteobacteria bacterium]|nr:DNA translocase FtsK 4TM domain-containing protein [Alphaproteobacteria bacterium]
MVKKDQEILATPILSEIIKKSLAILLFLFSLSLVSILITFNPLDTGWGVVSESLPTNLYKEIGPWLSGFIIKEFGIFPGLLLSSILFIWSLKLFNSSGINFLKTKLLIILIMIFLSSLGGTYIENILLKNFHLKFSIISQHGMSEWFLLYFSSGISKTLDLDVSISELILGISSFIISIILFIWTLSLDTAEIKFMKVITRPLFMPLIWVLSMFYNLFFVIHKKNENVHIQTETEPRLLNYFRNKLLNLNRNFIPRKKPKIRKNPILIKNVEKNDSLKNKLNSKDFFQDTLPLSSESGFMLPPVKLLKNVNEDIKPPSKETLDLNAKVLEGVLSDYSINGNIDSVRYGPVVTRYDLKPAPGLRSQRVISLADDIARSMSVEAVRVAMVPGQNVIGIELPNKVRETVILRNILEHQEFQSSSFNLPLCLGKNIAGYPVVVDLTKMPHLLVAGTTGSGKSVGINAMILSLLFKHTPETCRLIMIDPKMLELSVYDGIPHLLTPVVTEPKKAIVALKWAVREMETRYMSMSKLGVRNIDSYNQRLIEARKKGEILSNNIQVGFDPDTGQPIFEDQQISLTPLPFIVVVIDEVADLMLVAGKDIEAAVQRLAQMARAAGIHVVMATQRPSVDVITGTIKANFPTRISFQVTSKIDSRTILGEQGAEQLLGRGDMLYMAGGGKVTRVHGPFVEDSEVEKVTKFLSDQSVPDYDETITEEPEDLNDENFNNLTSKYNKHEDELYDQAVALIVRERRASTSFIQRHFKIGYNRA